jgi:sec-independent protein translocase protein TatA
MGEFSIWMIVLAIILLLFRGGKASGLMGELAKGIKAFRQTMAEDKLPVATQADRPEERVRQG